MRVRSIQASLLIGAIAGVVGILLGSGFVLERGMKRALLDQIDQELASKTPLLASTAEVTWTGVEADFGDVDMQEFEREKEPSHLVITLLDGTILYESPHLVEIETTRLGQEGGIRFRSVRPEDAPSLRIAELIFRPRIDLSLDADPDEKPPPDLTEAPLVHLLLARDLTSMEQLLARLRLALILVGLAAGLGAIAVLGLVIQRSLRPLVVLANQIGGLHEHKLSSRIQIEKVPAEMEPVVRRLNTLLGALEVAFQRERTFSADIAHELRTPLAALHTTLEVELSRTRSATEYRAALEDIAPIVERMQEMVLTLLQLAQIEAGRVPSDITSTDLVEMLHESWGPLAQEAERRHLHVQWLVPDVAEVKTDRVLAGTAIRNLVENAVEHSNDGGYVRLEVFAPSDRRFALRITNSGNGVAAELLPQLTERFRRADPAREANRGHFGLGLALVDRIGKLLEAPLELTTTTEQEFQASMCFQASEISAAANSPDRDPAHALPH